MIKNINLKNNTILLTYTKNGKPRNIYLCDDVKELIIKHITNCEIYLFEDTLHQTHVHPANIHNIIKRLKKDLNINSLSPHMFRHTYATSLLENGADLESIRLLLGHSDYSMIMRYVHIKEKKLAEISTSFNPLYSTTKGPTSKLVEN
jgi:integrase/recombinase XerD